MKEEANNKKIELQHLDPFNFSHMKKSCPEKNIGGGKKLQEIRVFYFPQSKFVLDFDFDFRQCFASNKAVLCRPCDDSMTGEPTEQVI